MQFAIVNKFQAINIRLIFDQIGETLGWKLGNGVGYHLKMSNQYISIKQKSIFNLKILLLSLGRASLDRLECC